MAEGYVYVLKNDCLIDDLYKIGMTTRSPEERAKELSAWTGVAQPFEVVFSKYVPDVVQVEAWVHEKLAECRHAPRKEFFLKKLDAIIDVINSYDGSISTESPGVLKQDFAYKNISADWQSKYPTLPRLKFLGLHEAFFERLVSAIMEFGPDIKMKAESSTFTFEDPIREFFYAMEPQKTKFVVAPLNLKLEEVAALNCSYRDIRSKKYRNGGEVRVDIFDHTEESFNVALLLAKMSFESKNVIRTWSILKRKKSG